METATASELRDCNGYLRHLARAAAARGDARDDSVIINDLLAHVGAPSLAEPLERLRQMAASLDRQQGPVPSRVLP